MLRAGADKEVDVIKAIPDPEIFRTMMSNCKVSI
jgi:hypothetical protein